MKIEIEIKGEDKFKIDEFYRWLRSSLNNKATREGVGIKINKK